MDCGDVMCAVASFLSRRPFELEDNACVGSHDTMVDGVNVSYGAVVGAGSAVTTDVQLFSVVAGVPESHIPSGYR